MEVLLYECLFFLLKEDPVSVNLVLNFVRDGHGWVLFVPPEQELFLVEDGHDWFLLWLLLLLLLFLLIFLPILII